MTHKGGYDIKPNQTNKQINSYSYFYDDKTKLLKS